MGNRATLLILVLVFCHGLAMTLGFVEDQDWKKEREEKEHREGKSEHWFLLRNTKRVVQTDAGDMRVVKSVVGRIADRPLHIGFITMEPKSLFIPQFVDSSLILFIHRGEAKVGLTCEDSLSEKRLKSGDVYRIPAGSTFYLVNTWKNHKLHVICSIDPSESLGMGVLQSFFIGGGTYPRSILSGFDHEVLSSAFNVSKAELRNILTRQQEGPIVHVSDSHAPSLWTKFLQLKEKDRLYHLKKMVDFQQQPNQEEEEEEEQTNWSWRTLLNSALGNDKKPNNKRSKGTSESPDSYNLYNKKPDYKNAYGWSIAVDEADYSPLERSGIGLYLVNLTAGSMLAPHMNPRATEYGIVLRGSGRIQIVLPNGKSAMNSKIKEGDVFFIPRYFSFCQIASRNGPLEFFGFTTSARRNRPQFLVGANSVLQIIKGPELAASFGVSEDRISHLLNAQHEAVILPTREAKTPSEKKKKHQKEEEKVKFERLPEVIKNFGNEMIMGSY
ncbi:Vicilin-like seed storage protein [Quillaja saponaria]|uniref:Vicilin-like seed storage protein n=1 Tax=Quillaja saponaria TaxID=32244 RepID=A0AAD7VMG9_QUISA|nr:Vicilin-like seed storage protein [Quillaja saponaria]